MRLPTASNLLSDSLHGLHTAILYITDKCNSRCIACDYWRYGQNEMPVELVHSLAADLSRLGTRHALLSGGEPLQHPAWEEIAFILKEEGIRVAMVTSGILLPRHAEAVAAVMDEIFVSLDGASAETYRSVRGVDGFELVREGIMQLSGRLPITIRTTVQCANYAEMPALIRLTRSWRATHHSFFPVDTTSHAAFARSGEWNRSMALSKEDLIHFARILDQVETECKDEFREGYVVESPAKLRRLHTYFEALLGLREFPPVRCNAPRFSMVVEPNGTLRPCFFLPAVGSLDSSSLASNLNSTQYKGMRRQQRKGMRQECLHCVCPAYKSMAQLLGEV